MSIDNFVPEIWSAALLSKLRSSLVYGQLGVINRDYEGDVAQAGDTVHITSIADVTVAPYVQGSTSITYEDLTDSTAALVVDESDYFAFKANDIDARQSLPGFVDDASQGAAYGIASAQDQYIADLFYAAVNGTANDLGARTADVSDNTAYDLFVDFRTTLNRDNVPKQGRWAIVPPELTAALLKDPRFIDASKSNDGGLALRTGEVGSIAGFTILESNETPDPTAGTYGVIAGHAWACTFANQINDVEAIRLESAFEDGVRGLSLYGGKVVRPTCLASASVTVQS